jgi:hypothetical protein
VASTSYFSTPFPESTTISTRSPLIGSEPYSSVATQAPTIDNPSRRSVLLDDPSLEVS